MQLTSCFPSFFLFFFFLNKTKALSHPSMWPQYWCRITIGHCHLREPRSPHASNRIVWAPVPRTGVMVACTLFGDFPLGFALLLWNRIVKQQERKRAKKSCSYCWMIPIKLGHKGCVPKGSSRSASGDKKIFSKWLPEHIWLGCVNGSLSQIQHRDIVVVFRAFGLHVSSSEIIIWNWLS